MIVLLLFIASNQKAIKIILVEVQENDKTVILTELEFQFAHAPLLVIVGS